VSTPPPNSRPLFPLFLKLDGHLCVMVGGGPVAAQKAQGLVECGARLRVVSPALDDSWQTLASAVDHVARPFQRGDVAGARLVFSATGDDAVDDRVVADARNHGILVNTVDVPHRCDFYAGAVVRRGVVQVAISTAGASPSLAIAVRKSVEASLPDLTAELAHVLGENRARLLEQFPAFGPRAERLNRAVGDAFPKMAGVSSDSLRRWMEQVLACEHDCARAERCCALACLEESCV
jgi:precorrin-2 dehydrogenase/sirohydrochlorin ferrochelatase